MVGLTGSRRTWTGNCLLNGDGTSIYLDPDTTTTYVPIWLTHGPSCEKWSAKVESLGLLHSNSWWHKTEAAHLNPEKKIIKKLDTAWQRCDPNQLGWLQQPVRSFVRTNEFMDDVEEKIDAVPMEPTGDEWTEEDQDALDSEEDDDGVFKNPEMF